MEVEIMPKILRLGGPTKPIAVRVPITLLDRLDKLKARASRLGLVVDVPAAVIECLDRLAAEAEAELDAREGKTPAPAKPAPVPAKPAAIDRKTTENSVPVKNSGSVADNALEGWQ